MQLGVQTREYLEVDGIWLHARGQEVDVGGFPPRHAVELRHYESAEAVQLDGTGQLRIEIGQEGPPWLGWLRDPRAFTHGPVARPSNR